MDAKTKAKKKRNKQNKPKELKFRLSRWKFALAGAILVAICVAVTTLFGLLGYFPFSNMLIADIYGKFGYVLSWPKVLLGTVYSFVDTFIALYIFVWIYNTLVR